jgi:hypothetical protein
LLQPKAVAFATAPGARRAASFNTKGKAHAHSSLARRYPDSADHSDPAAALTAENPKRNPPLSRGIFVLKVAGIVESLA